jgi:hypothetical protein
VQQALSEFEDDLLENYKTFTEAAEFIRNTEIEMYENMETLEQLRAQNERSK